MKKFILPLIISLIIIVGTLGCSQEVTLSKNEKVDIRGKITSVAFDKDQEAAVIFVKGKLEQNTSYDQANVRVTKNTLIYKGEPEQKQPVTILKKGMRVEIIFEEPIAESHPVQAKAKEMWILK